MVVDIRYIGGGFIGLVLLLVALSFSFDTKIEEKHQELEKKREVLAKLDGLEKRWSKKVQESELQKVYKLLDVFDVVYTKSEKRKRKVINIEVQSHNADKIVGMILNRSINIKKLEIQKLDEFRVKLVVEVL